VETASIVEETPVIICSKKGKEMVSSPFLFKVGYKEKQSNSS
jgi:hypothetical protein